MCLQTVIEDFPSINLIQAELQEQLHQSQSLSKVESSLFTWLMSLGKKILQEVLSDALQDQDLLKKARKITGKMKSKGRFSIEVLCLFGALQLQTHYWARSSKKRRGSKRKRRGRKGSGIYPVLWMWGIHDRCTPAAQAEISRTMLLCSSAQEASEILKNRGLDLSPKKVCRISYSIGSRALQARNHRLDHPELIPEEEKILKGRRIAVALDGGRYRSRTAILFGPRTKKRRRRFNSAWKEPKGFIIYVLDEEGKRDRTVAPLCDFVTGNADVIADLLTKYLLAYGVHDAMEVIFVADGAHWIWNRVFTMKESLQFEQNGVKSTEILDFYHAVEHLSVLSQLPKKWTTIQRNNWLKKQRKSLKHGEQVDVLEAICKLEELVSKKEIKIFKREKFYFSETNKDRTRYAEFKKQKCPIGSGAIESAIRRVINQRVKSNAIFWIPEHAEIIMHMRAQFKNGRFESMARHAAFSCPRIY